MAKKQNKLKKDQKVTPLMQQYFREKSIHPDAILLFRVGDFYETFGEDAILASKVLGIVLTARNNGGSNIELAGFPYHSLDIYLPKLVKAGYRVAICEQLEKPSKEKKIVKRGVTDIVTPGIATDDKLLDHRKNNFLATIYFTRKDLHGISFLDISTGEFLVSEGTLIHIEKLLQSFLPSEVVFSKAYKSVFEQKFKDKYYKFTMDEWIFTKDFTQEKLNDHFQVINMKGFGLEEMKLGQLAAGACLYYLSTTQKDQLQHVRNIQRIHPGSYLWLDRFTIQNLELIVPSHPSGIPLIDVLDQTVSPMGARLLKNWLLFPLIEKTQIEDRHNIVDYLIVHFELLDMLQNQLKSIGDLTRLISKVSLGKVNPRELEQLKKAQLAIAPIKKVLNESEQDFMANLGDQFDLCEELVHKLDMSLVETPPAAIQKGHVIKEGINEELDDLRNTISNSKELLLKIQQEEANRTGISSLKIGFNNVFGYYLEVTNKYKDQDLIPENWIRKQTLTNSERYITEELKKLEHKILNAEDRILELETNIFEELVAYVKGYIQVIQKNAEILAKLDCFRSFAYSAIQFQYCKPTMDDSNSIDIKEGRHPVIEQQLDPGESYIPNDVFLDSENQQILMITGPNMSGKSAVLRQTALTCLMAQIGSYVPASHAKMGIVDKLFSRVGASDNISSGESTFMVEMNETASIMNNISSRSLILMDEIGRGTSTYDGISIAWSIAEFLHENKNARPKTLFATHYHELNELADKYQRIKNFNVSVKEMGKKIIFLRKLLPGGTAHSFGIHVARMAGMPVSIIIRAQEILKQLEESAIERNRQSGNTPVVNKHDLSSISQQLSIFQSTDPFAGKLKKMIKELDIHTMTPIECMLKLNELIQLSEENPTD